ncbi:hypothetical protein M408DRAFT_13042 [Serendipita vermifera MAFF 305830]|uniref:Uncharacterized protein n=1 Tax=Serendipita vermifera MAFF 305830 TaxID=933852 RepID=A0A0C3A6V4_SERVB|nr:hypothetical protein M408DRAFT_13042 [Serendipita vermifera MAFF 305830]
MASVITWRTGRSRSSSPPHKLRSVWPTVKQNGDYLSISDTKHLFFGYSEAKYNLADKPLVLWLNGEPACSSSCNIKKGEVACCKEVPWVVEWMNKEEVKSALGVPLGRKFEPPPCGSLYAEILPLIQGNFWWMFTLGGYQFAQEIRDAKTWPWYLHTLLMARAG